MERAAVPRYYREIVTCLASPSGYLGDQQINYLLTVRAYESSAGSSQVGEKRRYEIGMNAQLVQDRLFIAPVPQGGGSG